MAKPMERPHLYFDNAATSFPKPEEVYLACDAALRKAGNPGRGAHRLALHSARMMFDGREAVGAYFGVQSDRIVFTGGCTAAINLVLNGLVGSGRLVKGDLILSSSYEHNAVMRPLQWLKKHVGTEVSIVAPAADHIGLVDLAALEKLLVESRPKLCVLSLASNVTGEVLALGAAADLCLRYEVPLLIDGAQGAGALTLDLGAHPGITFFAASAHKSLLGPPGLGLLFVREGEAIDPPYCGGTGSRSESFDMPFELPDRLEPGTPAVQLVAGLTAALEYMTKNGGAIRARERELAQYFVERSKTVSAAMRMHGRSANLKTDTGEVWPANLATFALSFANQTAAQIADALDRQWDIAVRPGLHCAVGAHQTLGTASGGLLRVSFGAFNTEDEIDSLCDALQSLVL